MLPTVSAIQQKFVQYFNKGLMTKMKKIFLAVAAFAFLNVHAQLKITVDGKEVINTMRGGFGATFYPMNDSIPVTEQQSWGGSTWGAVPDSKDEKAWQQIYKHLDWLGFDWCRVEIEHRLFQPEKGKFTWHQKEMENMYRFLDYAQKTGIDVFFQERYPNVKWLTPEPWQNDDILEVRAAPTDWNAWADGLVKLMNYLIKERKYTCIKYLCLTNEPEASWSWWKNYPDTSSYIITPAIKLMRVKLDASGLKQLPLSGLDWSMDPVGAAGYRKMDFNEYVGAYDLHAYNAKPDWWTKPFKWQLGSMKVYEKMFAAYVDTAHREGKPFFCTEFGSFFNGFDARSENVTAWVSVLKDIQLVVRFSNIGVDAFNKWSFLNRGDLDGKWQFINTWNPDTHSFLETVTPRKNQYWLYGMLTRLTPKYPTVLTTTIANGNLDTLQRVYATSYKSNKGNYSIVVVNDCDKEFNGSLELKNIAANKKLYAYELTEAEAADKEQLTITPRLFGNTGNKKVNIKVKPQSVLILSTYHLQSADKGVVND
jgi:Cellulase (glycosyl hydrolase family 5)